MIRERAVRFGPGKGLTGIYSELEQADLDHLDRPAVLLLNAGVLHRVGPSRFHVTLARTLSRSGLRVLRFDFSGIGDSEPRTDGVGFDEGCVLDVSAAIDFLAGARKVRTVVTGGICSGADASFRAAVGDERVAGIFQVDGYAYRNWKYYAHHYGSRLGRWDSWRNFIERNARSIGAKLGLPVAPPEAPRWSADVRSFPPRDEVAGSLQALSDRGVRQLHVYTAGQELYYNYPAQFSDNFSDVDFRGLSDLHYLAGADHTLTGPDQQALLIEMVGAWMDRHWPATRELEIGSGAV